MEKLFHNYPSVFYNGVQCCDISRRVKFSDTAKKNTSLYYPLELKAGMRADVLADAYYEDSELDWLVYLTNEIVDPYYQWYLNEAEFKIFIEEKYGSIEAAIKKIRCYRNNWASDDRELSPSFYENNLAYDQKHYWTPVYGNNAKILAYRRKQDDWETNTNRIVQFNIELVEGTFESGEIVDIKNDVGEVVANTTVITCNSSAVIGQHIWGDYFANTSVTKTLVGETSKTEANTNNVTILQENITDADAAFWKAVTWYDWEIEQNEKKKSLIIMNSAYTLDVVEQLRHRLAE